VERRIEQLEELERDVGLQLGCLHRVFEPGAQEGLAAKGGATLPGEGVPVGDGEAQVVLQAFAEYHFVLVVMAEGQRIGAVRAFVFYFLDVTKKSGAHVMSPCVKSMICLVISNVRIVV